MRYGKLPGYALYLFISLLLLSSPSCTGVSGEPGKVKTVPHENTWGIYKLNLTTQEVSLIYGTSDEIHSSALRLNDNGDTLVFTQKIDGDKDNNMEICAISISSRTFNRLTNNKYWDLYPAWSPSSKRIAFLSLREKDLDIYVMDADGNNVNKLYDSGFHDADIDWVHDTIVFTSQFAIWRIDADGKEARQITHPPNCGEWGQTNLPAGDYDPRLSPDGEKIVFERLENTEKMHGSYNFFITNSEGTNELRLTRNGYAQGLANWSNSGEFLIYNVAAIEEEGKYDIYMMNSDGTDIRNVTPSYFPTTFLCHAPVFSEDDASVYFIGQWWE